MVRAVLFLILGVVVACSKDSPVFGWWQVPDTKAAGDLRDSAVKLSADQVIVVRANGDVVVRDCSVEMDGSTGRITGCGPVSSIWLDGNRLTIDKLVATRVSASRAAELDAIATKQPPFDGDVCERARTCYRTAMTLLRVDSHEDEEFATMRGPTDCLRTTEALVQTLATNRKPIPADCR